MPTNNIIMKKIWQDIDILEIVIECSSNVITAETCVYVQISQLQKLYNNLKLFLIGDLEGFRWNSGEFGDNTTACVQFSFLHKDSQGHIIIEATMELDDGGPLSKHTCCFFIYAEIGMLIGFLQQLESFISDSTLGVSVFLVDPSTY